MSCFHVLDLNGCPAVHFEIFQPEVTAHRSVLDACFDACMDGSIVPLERTRHDVVQDIHLTIGKVAFQVHVAGKCAVPDEEVLVEQHVVAEQQWTDVAVPEHDIMANSTPDFQVQIGIRHVFEHKGHWLGHHSELDFSIDLGPRVVAHDGVFNVLNGECNAWRDWIISRGVDAGADELELGASTKGRRGVAAERVCCSVLVGAIRQDPARSVPNDGIAVGIGVAGMVNGVDRSCRSRALLERDTNVFHKSVVGRCYCTPCLATEK